MATRGLGFILLRLYTSSMETYESEQCVFFYYNCAYSVARLVSISSL